MGDFGKGIGLIHELGKLAGTKKLADRRHDRLSIDQIVRHGGRHFLIYRHLFLDGPFHPDQTNPELVFQQLAHRPNPAVAEMVDVIDVPDILAQFEQITDHRIEVILLQGPLIQARCSNPA